MDDKFKAYSGLNEIELEVKFRTTGSQVSLPRAFYEDKNIPLHDFSFERQVLKSIEELNEKKTKRKCGT